MATTPEKKYDCVLRDMNNNLIAKITLDYRPGYSDVIILTTFDPDYDFQRGRTDKEAWRVERDDDVFEMYQNNKKPDGGFTQLRRTLLLTVERIDLPPGYETRKK